MTKKKFEQTIDKALKEGFDLSDLLGGVKVAQVDVKVYLDSAAAYKAVELNTQIDTLLNSADESHSITDTPASKEIEELKKVREEMEKSAIVFTMRALSNSELGVIKRTVANKVKIGKNLGADERAEAENERGQVVNEHVLAVSCVSVVTADGRRNPGVTVDEAASLRKALPLSEWQKLVEGVNEAMARAQAADAVMSEPSFRWSDSIAE